MSDLLLGLFDSALEQLPYHSTKAMDDAERALEAHLDRPTGWKLFCAYDEARNERDWEQERRLFFLALGLGMELGRLTPSADACRTL